MVLSRSNRDFINTEPFPRAITDNNPYAGGRNKHLYGHHQTLFEKETDNTLSPRSKLDSFSRKQHFVHGKPSCGSSSNTLMYGGIPATAPYANTMQNNTVSRGSYDRGMRSQQEQKQSTGFLYGEHDTKVGVPQPQRRKEKEGLPPWMVDKTSAEVRKREMQAREIEEDIARSRLEKANQRAHKAVEQRKDLEMLQSYRPWGKPGGGAPRGLENDRNATMRTRNVGLLGDDKDQVFPFGKPGAGAPNRTESGRLKTKLAGDTTVRLRAHKDGRPVDFIPMKNANTDEYKTELDRQAEETRHRRHWEKEQDFQHDLETLRYDPYGRPGGGAPLRADDGTHKAGLPLQLSNDIYELRTKEPRNSHNFSGNVDEDYNQAILPKPDASRKEKQEVLRKEYSDEEMNQGFQFGMPGAGAPIRDKNGKIVAHGRQTLVKDKTGALVKSPTKPREDSTYFPFGKPGGGAPIRDDRGRVRAGVTGAVENEKTGKSNANQESIEAKKEYLSTLRKMQEERENQRNREKSDILEPAPAVSQWIQRGAVGRPKYDPYTHQIKADPIVTSDVTRQRMNIHPQASDKSRQYHNELDEIVRQREERKKKDSLEQRQKSVEHAKAMERAWGKPGNGAPNIDTKKAKIEMMPADHGMKWRDN
ncbi:uncharacterized protein LOC135682548 isoform X1 [Rhopilema esculentum]|uniref:uncharacterized protein LOC135682548 isoform X1 n=1 Tax=Rhopilema esculentum TaxID=499914 RepID=UPI0031E41C5C